MKVLCLFSSSEPIRYLESRLWPLFESPGWRRVHTHRDLRNAMEPRQGTQVRPEVEVKQVAIPQGEETYTVPHRWTQGKREGHPKAFL